MIIPELRGGMTPRRVRANRQVLAAAIGHAVLLALLLAAGTRALAAGQGMSVAAIWLAIGVGTCWNANTVAHIHLHTPLRATQAGNAAVSLGLTLLLGIPQQLWRRRHFAHHGLQPLGAQGQSRAEAAALVLAAGLFAAAAPRTFFGLFVPGSLLGLGLCALQGWGEHHRAPDGLDHHGRLYNRLWFNDGHHAAHHRDPDRHFSDLATQGHRCSAEGARLCCSPWPPVLRFLPALAHTLSRRAPAALLDALERRALTLAPLQRLLLASHAPALRQLLQRLHGQNIEHVVIVGGGLFPRSALLLGQLLPQARFTLLDAAPSHLDQALNFLPPPLRARIDLVCARFDPALPVACDLLVVPLALQGDRRALYRRAPAPRLLVHDWAWHMAGAASARVPWFLCKRINLVIGDPSACLSPVAQNTATLPLQPACSRLTSSHALPAAIATPS